MGRNVYTIEQKTSSITPSGSGYTTISFKPLAIAAMSNLYWAQHKHSSVTTVVILSNLTARMKTLSGYLLRNHARPMPLLDYNTQSALLRNRMGTYVRLISCESYIAAVVCYT